MDTRDPHRLARRLAVAVLSSATLIPAACSSTPSAPGTPDGDEPVVGGPTVKELMVTDHDGGTHHRIVMHDELWFQTFSNQLLVIDPRKGRVLKSLDLAPFGTTGPATDLALQGDTLWIVLARTGVAQVDVSVPARPELVRVYEPSEIGVQPWRVTSADGQIYVSGIGGVTRMNDGRRFLVGNDRFGPVVPSAHGPVTSRGREVITLDGGRFVGLAHELVPAVTDDGQPVLLFALQADRGARVGVMSTDLQEISSAAVPGALRSLRYFNGRMWAVTDTEVAMFTVGDGTVGSVGTFRVRGARDVGPVQENVLAVSGSFGRALYRVDPEGSLPGDTFFNATRAASKLSRAISDNRRVLAGSDQGVWMYLIGDEARLSDRELELAVLASQSASFPWGSADAAEDRRSVTLNLSSGEKGRYVPDGSPMIGCVTSIDGDCWIGHEYGIDVISADEDGSPKTAGTLRFEGLVKYIFPKWDGGATYVSEFGGFGTAEFEDRPMTRDELAASNAAAGRN